MIFYFFFIYSAKLLRVTSSYVSQYEKFTILHRTLNVLELIEICLPACGSLCNAGLSKLFSRELDKMENQFRSIYIEK